VSDTTLELPLCSRCDALCCRDINVPLTEPATAEDFDWFRWYLTRKEVHIYRQQGRWMLKVATDCEFLDQNTRLCGIY
jgi:Fe-S-cluster containining protein